MSGLLRTGTHGIHWTHNVAVAVASLRMFPRARTQLLKAAQSQALPLLSQKGTQITVTIRSQHTNTNNNNNNGNASPNAIRKAMTCLSIHPPSAAGIGTGGGTTTTNHLSMGLLRNAYFEAAKECHPDSASASTCQSMSEAELNERFLQVTEAYELLQTNLSSIGSSSLRMSTRTREEDGTHDNDDSTFTMRMEIDYITKSEEENFRTSCREILGLDAETVEESKQCPLFREWLKGRTDAAFTWNTFFMLNGGLAPMLNTKKTLSISEGTYKIKRRRRKP